MSNYSFNCATWPPSLVTYSVAVVWTNCMGRDGLSCALKVSVRWQMMKGQHCCLEPQWRMTDIDDRGQSTGDNERQWDWVKVRWKRVDRERREGQKEWVIVRVNRGGGTVDWSKQTGISRWKWVESREENGLSFGNTAFVCVCECACSLQCTWMSHSWTHADFYQSIWRNLPNNFDPKSFTASHIF